MAKKKVIEQVEVKKVFDILPLKLMASISEENGRFYLDWYLLQEGRSIPLKAGEKEGNSLDEVRKELDCLVKAFRNEKNLPRIEVKSNDFEVRVEIFLGIPPFNISYPSILSGLTKIRNEIRKILIDNTPLGIIRK